MQDTTVRRHLDGALDIDHHRRVAERLRRVARRSAMRAVGRALLGAAPGRLGWITMVGMLLCGVALAEPAPTYRSEVLEVATHADGRVFRLVEMWIAPGAATARHRLSGESLMLVARGTLIRETDDGEATVLVAGSWLDGEQDQVLRNVGPGDVRLMIGTLTAPWEPPAYPPE